ncbi:MAG: endo-1,4-beta-xylanase, partial [Oscillospiraceae bacterium]|nr:endo-1,4-beta-xylanase [Oscillospiraceae bacterium]
MVKTFKRSIAILCCLAITLSPMVSVTPAQASGVDLVVRLGGSENPWPVHAEDEIKLEFEGPPVPFNITREFTALGVSLLSANLRLHTADSENNFYIDDIFISVGGDVIYDMQTDSLVPEIGESLGSGGGSTMVINDNAKVTIVEYEGKKSLYCTNRPANWHAISVRYEALKALVGDNDCTLTILGRVEPEEAPEPGPDDVMWNDVPSLKDTYKDYFLIGNISNPGITIRGEANEIMTEMFSYHYNSVTGENHFKPDSYRSSKGGKYDFANKDDTMAWAKDNGLQVYGHALAWHSQSAPWLHPEGTTRAEARANMEEFFSQIAGHFEAMYDHSSPNSFGNLAAWDVLNEAHLERSANWRENLRTDNDGDDSSPWYAAYENGADTAAGESGADYIYDMFVLARKYAPSSTSYYSDFNDDNATKSAAIAAMVNELNAQWAKDTDNNPDAGDFNGSDDRAVVQAYLDAGGRLLIEGIAMQAHYNTQVRPENVRASLERFAATGAMVSITELDITIDPDHVGENEDKIQALLYAELFAIYKEFKDVVERVTFWGLRDNMSWRSQGNPLIFE